MLIPFWSYPIIAAVATAVYGVAACQVLRGRKTLPPAKLWLHSINQDLCVGCGNCDDVCPRDPLGTDPHPDGTIVDKGCGGPRGGGTFGDPLTTDVFRK